MKISKIKKINLWLLAAITVAVLVSCLALSASAAEVLYSGTLGQYAKTAWTIYDNGLLVIDGKGNTMTSINWDSTTASPWKTYSDVVTRVSFANCQNWKSLPAHSFKSLYNLKEVTLPENLEVIQQLALGYTAIETIELPQSLTTIGEQAFSSCKSLNYVNIHSGITKIGSSAFSDCVSLKAISIPDSVASIGQTLFKNCGNLEYVRLSESVDKVGGSMFSGCTMLKNISLPASVTVIGVNAFSNASNLAGIYYHGIDEPTTYNPGINNATFSLAPDTMVIYASNDYSGTTMGLKATWENDVHNVTKIDGYFVNVAHTIGGAVKVDKGIVPVGDTVTVDIMSYKNYALETFAVTDADGNEITVSGDANTHTFAMPAGDVIITATFKSTIVPHVHSWTFEAEGTYINAACANTDGACHNPYQSVVMTKPSLTYFVWNKERTVTVSGTIEDVEIPEVVYTLKSTGEEVRPFEPGVYVASLTIENTTLTCEYEITKSHQLNYSFFTYTASANLTYDGTAKVATVVPNATVDAYIGEVEVLYGGNSTPPTDVGEYVITINVAESDYFSAKTNLSMGGRGGQKFSIVAKDIGDLTYSELAEGYPMDDEDVTPDVTIQYNGMTLVKDTDYTLEYANNTAVGTANMTITGMGNYTGTKTLEFEIVPKTSYTISVDSAIENGTIVADVAEAEEGATVTLTVTPAEGYELDTLTVTDADGGMVTVDVENKFTMPAKAVTVTATFKAADTTTTTIYFDNSTTGWDSVNAYYWSATNTVMTTWPGVAMTLVTGEENIYSITVPADAQYVIFNNGSSQTDDLTIPTDGRNMYDYGNSRWTTYTPGSTTEPTEVSFNAMLTAVDADGAAVTEYLQTMFEEFQLDNSTLSYLTMNTGTYELTFDENDVNTVIPEGYKTPDAITLTISDGGNGNGIVTSSDATVTTETVEGETVYVITVTLEEETTKPITYTVTVATSENGTVEADVSEAAEGETVTLTIAPATGYELDTLTVSDGTNEIELTKVDGTTYTFVMVDSDVTVSAAFKESEMVIPTVDFLTFEGYSVRMHTYNGMRSEFKADLNKLPTLEEDGYEVIEYGTIIASSDRLAANNAELTVSGADGVYSTLSYAAIFPIFKNGVNMNKYSIDEESNILTYYCTVKNNNKNTFDKNVTIRGYAVIRMANGNEYVQYIECAIEEYRSVSLETVCNALAADSALGITEESCLSYADVLRFRRERTEQQ